MIEKGNWRTKHLEVIKSFLQTLNKKDKQFILKGGTSLMLCYNLTRFSEDIDLDAITNRNLENILKSFCNYYGYTYKVAKDTDTVKRYFINYDGEKSLKIEISYRRKNISKSSYTDINNILVYNLDELAIQKSQAYASRDKIRDLYDVCFIINHYWNELSSSSHSILTNALEYKGIEQFDYILKEQHDELIDENELAEAFLNACDKIGLIHESDDDFSELENEINNDLYL